MSKLGDTIGEISKPLLAAGAGQLEQTAQPYVDQLRQAFEIIIGLEIILTALVIWVLWRQRK